MDEENKIPKEEMPVPPPPPEAPVDPREAKAVKMLITFHPDSQEIQVQNVQNLTRPIAMYVASRVLKTYENDEMAMSVVSKLANLVEKSKSGEKLWVPGSKR